MMPPLVASSDADEGSDAPGINNHCTSRLSNSFKLCIVPAAVAAAAAPTKPSRNRWKTPRCVSCVSCFVCFARRKQSKR